MDDAHQQISEDRLYFFERADVTVADFPAEGYILDIGGGGEGVIGRLKGQQVIAIDPSRRELQEAAPGPLKIVMDAGALQFLDGAFRTATSFFTLMYIKPDAHHQALSEICRVLVPGGRLLVWDALFPPHFDECKDIAVLPLRVRLPETDLETGYGTFWPKHGRSLAYYLELAAQVGFRVAAQEEHERWFYLELVKPEQA